MPPSDEDWSTRARRLVRAAAAEMAFHAKQYDGALEAVRLWLSLEPDAAWATSRKRLWANWHVEREAEPYTKVIHPR